MTDTRNDWWLGYTDARCYNVNSFRHLNIRMLLRSINCAFKEILGIMLIKQTLVKMNAIICHGTTPRCNHLSSSNTGAGSVYFFVFCFFFEKKSRPKQKTKKINVKTRKTFCVCFSLPYKKQNTKKVITHKKLQLDAKVDDLSPWLCPWSLGKIREGNEHDRHGL